MKDEEIMLKMMYEKLKECFNADNSVPKWNVERKYDGILMTESQTMATYIQLYYDEDIEEWRFACNNIPYYVMASVNEIIEEINKEYPYPEVTYEVCDRLTGKTCGEYANEEDARSKLNYLLKIEGSDFVIKKITREVMM